MVRDARSSLETLVNGEAKLEGLIENGGWIKAGETVFSVHFEGKTPPRRHVDVSWTNSKRRALDALSGVGGALFAVLDAARDERILQIVRESAEESRSLYDGVKGEALASVAPYLVRLSPKSRLLEPLVREGWGRRWGIYVASPEPFLEVRRHLRRFLMVVDDTSGKRLYFRYYDPDVLRVFLGCASVRQRAQLFARVDCVVLEDDRGEPVIARE